jgi:hypothetical protein
MGRIAMPISNGNLCDRFEDYQYFLVFDFGNPHCVKEEIKYPPHPGLEKLPKWLLAFGITDIIVRGIDHEAVKLLNHNKIHVFVGVREKNPEQLIIDYLNNKLDIDEHMCY